MNTHSGLNPDHAVDAGLRDIARDVLREAEAVLADAGMASSVAIHEFRKAMKRWRALLRLLSPFLGEEGLGLRHEARDLARTFTTARDVQSAIDIFADLAEAPADGLPVLSERSIGTIRARLESAKSASETITWDTRRRALLQSYVMAAAAQVQH